jgi:hypothetical protein
MRLPTVRLGLTVACVITATASAHHSASRWTSFHATRYLVCTDAPATKAECVGPVRAKRSIVDTLAAGHVDRAHDAAINAVYFNVVDAIPNLTKLLAGTERGLQTEAAYALVHLGDKRSAAKIAELVRELEVDGRGTLWKNALEALAIADPAAASRYAIDFVSRVKDWRLSMPGGSSKEVALDFIRDEHRADALPVLERLAKAEERGYDHAHCLLMAARVRLDDRVREQVRTMFVGSYSGTWLAGCANDVMPMLGVDPEDAAALVRHLGRDDRGMDFGMANISYRRLLDLIVTMDAMPPSARVTKAREVLRRGLAERNKWPHVADPKHASYSLHFVAFHRAALAGLGESPEALYEIVDDPNDREGNAWIGAYWALRLRLPDAADHAIALAQRSLTFRNDGRGDVYRGIRVRTLDAFADAFPNDPRWPIFMLDPDRDVTERATYRFSRSPSAKACEPVALAAKAATPEGVEHALLGLTPLGAACLPAIERLFLDASVHGEIRGAALEFLAVLESPKICEQLARARAEDVWRPAIERAELLVTRPCNATPPPHETKPQQPLPPRSHRQGI